MFGYTVAQIPTPGGTHLLGGMNSMRISNRGWMILLVALVLGMTLGALDAGRASAQIGFPLPPIPPYVPGPGEPEPVCDEVALARTIGCQRPSAGGGWTGSQPMPLPIDLPARASWPEGRVRIEVTTASAWNSQLGLMRNWLLGANLSSVVLIAAGERLPVGNACFDPMQLLGPIEDIEGELTYYRPWDAFACGRDYALKVVACDCPTTIP